MKRNETISMIGQIISHYKVVEKLGEVPNLPTSVSSPEGMASPRVVGSLSERLLRHGAPRHIPLSLGGSGTKGII